MDVSLSELQELVMDREAWRLYYLKPHNPIHNQHLRIGEIIGHIIIICTKGCSVLLLHTISQYKTL